MATGEFDEFLEVGMLALARPEEPIALDVPKSNTGTCLTADTSKWAGTSDKPIPAATRASARSSWSV
jgi:hypothetical protein